jgi:DnaK suppressor protein
MTLETINSRQLEYFRRRLLTWRDELTTESEETAYLPDQEASVDFKGHAANAANSHTFSQSSQEREQTLIHKIDETLRRIKEGTYGMQRAF